MKHATIFFVTLLAGYWSLPANAIVNIEDMRVGEPVAGYSGNVDLSIEGKTGNSDKQELSLDSRLQHYQDKVLDFVILSYDYGEASNVRNDNATLVHGRHVVQYHPKRAWEVFLQAEQDEFTRLSFRGLAGGDIRFTLIEEQDHKSLYFGAGAYYSRETLEYQEGTSDAGSENFTRGSFYLSYKRKYNPQVTLASTAYYQPRVNDIPDYRVFLLGALAVKMTDTLAIKLSLEIKRDSRPPQLVEKNDVSYFTGLSYQF